MASAEALLTKFFDVFAAPAQAFRKLNGHPTALFPLLLLLAAWVAVWNWYYGAVDFSWLIGHLIETQSYGAPADQQAEISRNLAKLKPGALTVISTVSVIVILMLVTTITSAYLTVVSAVYDDKYRFRHWFAFVLWGSLPTLFTILAMVGNFLLAGDRRLAPDQLNPLSFNHLFFHIGLGNGWKAIVDQIDLAAVWSWVVMIIGYREWTGRSALTSALIILAPVAVLYAVWAGFSLH